MNSRTHHNTTIFYLLFTALICVCIGRAYQAIFWDIPIRSLLWNEDVFSSLVQTVLGLDWQSYLTNPKADGIISDIVTSIGILLLALLAISLTRPMRKLWAFALWCIFLILLFIAGLYHLEKFRTAGQFFEYSLQFMTPILCWLYLKEGFSDKWILITKIAIALTFTSHGLYALGFYPVSGNFVAMTIEIFNCSDANAVTFLKVAGIIDVLASIGIFLSGHVFRWSIWYCIIWGALTALARIVANVGLVDFLSSMHQWGFETVYRAPHFLVPILLYLIVVKIQPKLTVKV